MAGFLEPVEHRVDFTHHFNHKGHPSLGKKYRKGRIISQRFSKQERVDARRETAKAFLLSIPLDKNPVTDSHWRLRSLSKVQIGNSPENESNLNTESSADRLAGPKTDQPVFQRNVSVADSPKVSRTKRGIAKKHSQALMSGDTVSGLVFKDVLSDSRRLALLTRGYPSMYFSVLPYEKPGKKNRIEGPVTSHHRIRTNSSSAHVDIGGLGLADLTQQEFSLASSGMLSGLWIVSGKSANSPLTPRYQSAHKMRTPLTHQLSLREGLSSPPPVDSSSIYPWHFFRENHTPQYVLVNYHPDCLDNRDHFIGRHLTILNLPGYTVSVIKYARESEIKRAINEQFSDVFPHVKITLTKLRSIKQEMVQLGLECGLTPVPLAHSHVYFEKLVLMGNVNKANRKILAFVSLILAAKFASDMKRTEIKTLIEEVCDKLRLSQKELVSFEFETLVALQFSLLTPLHQLQQHYDRIVK